MKLIAGNQDFVRGGTQKDIYSEEDVIRVPCPFCQGSSAAELYREHGAVGVSECKDCGLIYTSPRIREPEAIYWGNADTYYEEMRLVFEGKLPHHRDPNYLHEIRAIEALKPTKGRFLDVGCNAGMLLRMARQRGWDVTGCEPSPSLASLAKKHGFPVHNCFLGEIPASEERSFDVVALSDVFEHVTQPLAMLADARRYLKDDGVLFVKVPNARWSLLKQRLLAMAGRRPEQGLWDAYEHVVHYTDESLRKMLEKGGFKVVQLSIDPPVQTPNWHEHVGHYYQYPTPWTMDFQRKLVRQAFYWMSLAERVLRFGRIGACAPNLAAVAIKG